MSGAKVNSVAQMFLDRVQSTPDRQAFQYPTADGWGSITWAQTGERVRAIACGLHALGLQPEQRVGLVSNTRYEWILCDLGALCAGCATTTVYPSNTADECAYILTDSASQVVFAEDDSQVAKLVEKRSALGGIKQVITIDGQAGHDGWVITLAELEQKGRQWEKQNDGKYQATVEAIRPEQLATLIYTSGTTGRPKGVELTHDCWIATGQGIDGLGILSIADHQYLWLPLAHSFGKVLQTAQLAIGFSTTVDGRIPKLVENLAVVKPTFMAAAPRIFEKVYNKVVTGAQEAGGLKSKIFGWAVKNGRKVSELRQRGEEPSGFLALKYAIAEKLVFSKLQALFGGRLRFFISGSAPLSRDIAEFFHAAGVLILEGYGLTETSAASFVNRPNDYKFGTVGKGLGDMRVKIAEEDGEILLAGRGVMRGYHNLAEATAEVLPGDGWFRTGDIGEVDAEGFLRITDRKKDLIKTSGGKYVAPQNLESKLKTLCPYIGNVVVHGDKRNFCTALITIDEESITKWAADNGVSGDYRALTQHEKVRQMVQDAVDQLNAGLARYETIKKFAILESDFSVESGELTPSLKVKRKEVERRYASVLDQFYQGQLAS